MRTALEQLLARPLGGGPLADGHYFRF